MLQYLNWAPLLLILSSTWADVSSSTNSVEGSDPPHATLNAPHKQCIHQMAWGDLPWHQFHLSIPSTTRKDCLDRVPELNRANLKTLLKHLTFFDPWKCCSALTCWLSSHRESLALREPVVVMDLQEPVVSLVTRDPLELLELLWVVGISDFTHQLCMLSPVKTELIFNLVFLWTGCSWIWWLSWC